MTKERCLVCKQPVDNAWFVGCVHDECVPRIEEIVINEDNIKQYNEWYANTRKELGLGKEARK
jgi:hypothetical protein